MNFLHYFHPQPIIAQIGPLTLRWYGLFIAIGLLLCVLIASRLARRRGLPLDDILDLAFWVTLSGIIGARLYDVFFIAWDYYGRHPLDIIKVWEGGLAIHGAVIGGLLALLFFWRRKKFNLLAYLDIAAVVLPLGQAVGRWGNYFNQELFGGPTGLPWGIPIDPTHRPPQFFDQAYFHPAFLYESIMNLILFGLLYLIYKKNPKAGIVTCIYFIGYGFIRIFTEFIRIDETTLILGIRLPQLYSGGVIIVAAIMFAYLCRHANEYDRTQK